MVCVRAAPNFRPGFGLSRRISPIMSVMSSSSTPQSLRTDARGIEFLQHRKHGVDILLRCAEPLRGLPQIGRQVTRFVDQVDQILPDYALRRRAEGNRELLGEMVAKGHLGGDEGFEIVVLVTRGAATPFGID